MSEDHTPPFIEDGSQFGISQSFFAELEPGEQRELMIQWFFHNFEDPINETPWDGETKDYVYIWGGPYSASDQMWEKFGGLVAESLIAEVVDKIEKDGSDWAPRSGSPFYDDGRDEEDERWSEPTSLEIYLDEPTSRYGSPEEQEARAEALEAIENLRKALEVLRPIGLGHNRPPDDDEESEGIRELPKALQELSCELRKPNPEIAIVKLVAAPLRNAVIASAKWSMKKIDGALTAVLNTSAIGGTVWIFNHPEYLDIAYSAVIKWLDIAAKSLF